MRNFLRWTEHETNRRWASRTCFRMRRASGPFLHARATLRSCVRVCGCAYVQASVRVCVSVYVACARSHADESLEYVSVFPRDSRVEGASVSATHSTKVCFVRFDTRFTAARNIRRALLRKRKRSCPSPPLWAKSSAQMQAVVVCVKCKHG